MSDNQYDVVVYGSAMVDFITYCNNLPKPGETIQGINFQKSYGGKGANQALQSCKIGSKTSLISIFGSDSLGKEYYDDLAAEGMNLKSSRISENKENNTGIASINVEVTTGKNTIIILPGSNLELCLEDLINFFNTSKSRVAVFQNEIRYEENLKAMKYIKSLNDKKEKDEEDIVTIFNPSPCTKICLNYLSYVDILVVNEIELQELSEVTVNLDENEEIYKKEIEKASEVIIKLMNSNIDNNNKNEKKAIIVTLGPLGSCLVLFDSFSPTSLSIAYFQTNKVKAIDTVGAGDSFLGCLAAHLSHGNTLSTSINHANWCASQSVQKKGAQSSYISYKDDNFPNDQLLPLRSDKFNKDSLFI